MYKQNKMQETSMKINNSIQGETIEQKIMRVVHNNEPITDGAPIIYTERKDGVLPEHDIRTDRFEIAVEAMDKVAQAYDAKRNMAIQERTYDTMTNEQQQEFHKKYPNSKIKPKNPETGANTSDKQ